MGKRSKRWKKKYKVYRRYSERVENLNNRLCREIRRKTDTIQQYYDIIQAQNAEIVALRKVTVTVETSVGGYGGAIQVKPNLDNVAKRSECCEVCGELCQKVKYGSINLWECRACGRMCG